MASFITDRVKGGGGGCSINAAGLQYVASAGHSAEGQKKVGRISAAGIQLFCSTNLKNNNKRFLGPALYRSCTCFYAEQKGRAFSQSTDKGLYVQVPELSKDLSLKILNLTNLYL